MSKAYRVRERRLNLWWSLAAIAMLLTATAVRAQTPGSGELRVRDAQGHTQTLASLDTEVHVQVDGLVAEATVHQRFHNAGNDELEGEYLLPLPAGAAVYAMTLRIGERTIVGEVRKKEAARQAFAQARSEGRKAALVETDGANLFRTAVTHVAPGQTVDVELHYWQRIEYREGEFSLRFPLTYTPRYRMRNGAAPAAFDPGIRGAQAFASASSEPPLAARITVTLDAGVPLAGVDSPSHPIVATHDGDRWQVRLRDASIVPNRDFVLRWQPQPLAVPSVASFVQDIDGARYAMLMVMPPQQQARILPRELILVIDTSGSMGGASIRQARAALDLALAQLRPQDRFNVIEFNSDMRSLHPEAVAATPAAVQAARVWVTQLQAGGGTEMYPALQRALQGHAPPGYVRQVVFATDGAVDNPAGLMGLIDRELGDSRLFPVGIGSAPNADFLQAAARHGRGSETLIADLHQVGAAIHGLLAKLDHPALRDIRIDWPHGADAYPRQLPDLYLGEPLLVVARLQQPGGRAQLHGQLADRAWTSPVMLDKTRPAVGLRRLWAQARIADLEDRLARGGDNTNLKPKIIETALAAHLVSRYTSLVAVDRTPVRGNADRMRHVQIPNVLPAGTAFAQTATPARLYLLLMLVALLLAGIAWRMQRRGAR